MTDLGTLGGNYSTAHGINDSGQIVGYSDLSSGLVHGFISENGSMTDLGPLGWSTSHAYGINDSGQVVGTSNVSPSPNGHAFIWENGSMTDLNDLLLNGSQWEYLREAWDINEKGQIVGWGVLNSEHHAFLLDPVPAVPIPTTMFLLGSGLVGLAGFRRKFKK